jgi:hypothetical protein
MHWTPCTAGRASATPVTEESTKRTGTCRVFFRLRGLPVYVPPVARQEHCGGAGRRGKSGLHQRFTSWYQHHPPVTGDVPYSHAQEQNRTSRYSMVYPFPYCQSVLGDRQVLPCPLQRRAMVSEMPEKVCRSAAGT